MNIICITAGQRPKLIEQTFRSLRENAANWSDHHLTVVMDGCSVLDDIRRSGTVPDYVIVSTKVGGASRARNVGAASVPKYRRQDSGVCFFDDDIYAMKDWDQRLWELLYYQADHIATCHAHPYNGSEPARVSNGHGYIHFREPLVISTVNMAMHWSVWDDVGPFDEPGGSGGSEDFALCMRAKAQFYGFAVTEPQTIVHCGLTSSTGKRIVGYEEMMAQNERLVGKGGERVVYE